MFVIAGLVLLLLVGLAFLLVGRFKGPLVSPGELDPLKAQFEECMALVGAEGVRELALRGGYLEDIPLGPASATEEEGVRILSDSLIIPYWHYMSSPNVCQEECQFATQRPTLEAITTRLSNHVSANVPQCVDLTAFKGYTVTPEDEPVTHVELAQGVVHLTLEYPLKVTGRDFSSRIGVFEADVPADLLGLYELATRIVQVEQEDAPPIEMVTQSMLAILGHDRDSPIPPMHGPVDLSVRSPNAWFMPDVQEKIKGLLAEYIPFLTVAGTRGSRLYSFGTSDFSAAVFGGFILRPDLTPTPFLKPTLTADRTEVSAVFIGRWEPYLDIQPRRGPIVMPQSLLNFKIIPFGITQYQFTYDLSYPVVFQLTDPSALGGEGLTFQFAVEVNLRNNEPLSYTGEPLGEAAVRGSLFGEPPFEAGVTVNVLVKDLSGAPLAADVTYQCGEDAKFLGRTGADGRLQARLPVCIGGTVEARADGFGSAQQLVHSLPEGDRPFEAEDVILELPLKVDIEIAVEKYRVRRDIGPGGTMLPWAAEMGFSSDLDADDAVTITLTNTADQASQAVEVRPGQPATVPLTAGAYKVDAFAQRLFGIDAETGMRHAQDSYTIPEKEECVDPGILHRERCYTYPAHTFTDTMVIGGVALGEGNPEWAVGPGDLAAGRVTVYILAVEPEDLQSIKDLDVLDTMKAMYLQHRDRLTPEFG